MKHLRTFENFGEFDPLMNDIESFINSYKHGRVVAKRGEFPNFYVIRFELPSAGRGEVISIGGKLTGTGQQQQIAKKDAEGFANAIKSEMEREMNLEDASIGSYGNIVELFMVSNEFAKEDRWEKPIINNNNR